jgi:hypothetical protein
MGPIAVTVAGPDAVIHSPTKSENAAAVRAHTAEFDFMACNRKGKGSATRIGRKYPRFGPAVIQFATQWLPLSHPSTGL